MRWGVLRGRTTQKLLAFATASLSLWVVVGVRLFFLEPTPELAANGHDQTYTLISETNASSKTDNIVRTARRSSANAHIVKADWRTFEQPRSGRCTKVEPDQGFVEEMLVDPQTIGTEGGPQYERRVALVIGNGDYRNPDELPILANPVNDARSVTRALSALGFTVYSGADLTESQTTNCLEDFYEAIEGDRPDDRADVAMLYYAGHGLADAEGVNLLLPINASFADEAKTQLANALPVDEILTEMRKRAASSLLFLDACRNSLGRGLTAIRQNGRSAAASEDDAPDRSLPLSVAGNSSANQSALGGFYYVYAAALGQTASDGNGEHSPFTEAFLKNVAEPGVIVQPLVSRITADVIRSSKSQVPFADGSLTEDIYFVGEVSNRDLETLPNLLSQQSTIERQKGLRGKAIVSALKALPPLWEPDDTRFSSPKRVLAESLADRNVWLTGHSFPVHSAAFSPDGTLIVTASGDGTAKIWDAETGTELRTLTRHEGEINSAAFSADGTKIVTGSGGGANIWDAATGDKLMTLLGPKGTTFSAAFSPDGSQLVTASHIVATNALLDSVIIWNVETGDIFRTLTGHAANVLSAAFSPDGALIATAIGDGTAKIWDARKGIELKTLSGHASRVRDAAFSPDGTRVVTASEDSTAKVWDAETGDELMTLTGHSNTVLSSSYSPDGTLIVTASEDGMSKVWDAETGKELKTFTGHSLAVRSAVFSPDGSRIVTTSSDWTAKIWDARKGVELKTLVGHTYGLEGAAFGPEGSRIVTASRDNTAKIWDVKKGVELKTLIGHTYGLEGAAFSSDGKLIVTASTDRTAKVWDAKNAAELYTLTGHNSYVSSVAFSPDNDWVVTASSDTTAKVWEATTGAELKTLRGHSLGVSSAVFSPDGSRIATAGDTTTKIWDIETGEELKTLTGHSLAVRSVAYSPDGSRLVSASSDWTAKIWDAGTGVEINTLAGHTFRVRDAAFSPDGSRIVTGSEDSTAKIWDAETGDELMTLTGHSGEIASAAFSPDGTQILTASKDGTAKIWEAGLWGQPLVDAAYDLLTDDLRLEVERERIRYWEVDEAALQ